MKIIPAVDLLGGKVVRLVKGDPNNMTVYSDDPVRTAKAWEREGADALHVVDLDATLARGSNTDLLERIAGGVSIPVQAAGGIRTPDLAKRILERTERIVVGTLAYRNPEAVAGLVGEFGSERIVVAIDQMGGNVMIGGWQRSTGLALMDAIAKFTGIGVRYFLLTSIERDGTLMGPDVDTLARACGSTDARIMASGGVSRNEDVLKVKQAGAYAVILGKALYDGKVSIRAAKELSR